MAEKDLTPWRVNFCYIYKMKPKKVIQIGCGLSTSVILQASLEADYNPEIVCIEPYPNKFIKKIAREGKITLLAEKAQDVSVEVLTDLGEQGLLFIDSTHTVKPGSEVNRIILEVLPRLKKGNYVHFHDIYFPYDYGRNILTDCLFFWNESPLLHAFLINNSNYTIKASLSMLHYGKKNELKKYLINYSPQPDADGLPAGKGHYPSSIYLQVKS